MRPTEFDVAKNQLATSSSHNGSSPVAASASRAAHSPLTMSSSVTNSPAGLMNSALVQASPHSNSSPQSGDESLHSLNSLNAPQHPPHSETNHHLVNNLNNSPLLNSQSASLNSNSTSPSEHGLGQSAGAQLHLNNRSPIANGKTGGSPSSLANGGVLPLVKTVKTEPGADLKAADVAKLHQQQFNETMYNQSANSSNGNPTLNGLIANSQLLSNSSAPSSASSNHPANHSPSSIKMKIESNDTSLNSSINSTISPSNSAQQPPLTTSVQQVQQNVQWTGTQTAPNNFNGAGRFQATVNNSSSYQSNQFAPNSQSINASINPNAAAMSSGPFQPNGLPPNGNQPPYLDYNSNNNYPASMLGQPPPTPPCTVPNMFTAAAVAANSSKLSASGLNGGGGGASNSEFPFNNGLNSLNKKYLNAQQSMDGGAPVGLETGGGNLDQAMFYGNSNGSAPLNKSAGSLQSSLKPHQAPEFSTLLANNYANFAPNSNAYWQPGSTPQQMAMTNGSAMYQPKMQSNLQQALAHHTPNGHQALDEASQASTPNSQLDDLRSDTPNTTHKLSAANGQTYLTSMNGVSNNSSSNSSTGSMASSANGTSLNGKGMTVYSFPPTPNTTIGSPGASVMSGYYEEYEPAPQTTWSKSSPRVDGLMKLYEINPNEPGRKLFLDKLIAFNEERGNTVNSCPSINKGLIDLYRLYSCVKERGGFVACCKSKLWKECANICNIKQQPTSSYILRKQYVKHLLPFECKFDLNGANPDAVFASTESPNRKKRKKNAEAAAMQAANPMNGQMGSPPLKTGELPPMSQMPPNQPPIGLQSPPLNPSVQGRHLAAMQQGYSAPNGLNGSANLPNNVAISGSGMPGQLFNASQQTGAAPGYNYPTNGNYVNSNMSNYGAPNGPYANGMFNAGSQSVDYQGKLNHQLSVQQQQQQQQFFSANQSAAQMLNAGSGQPGVNAAGSQSLHGLPSANQLNAGQPSQYYQPNQPNSMYGNVLPNGAGSTGSAGPVGAGAPSQQQQQQQQLNSNDFYANYPNPSLIHSNNQIYSSNSSMQFSDELAKYNSSRSDSVNSSTHSSLPSSNQLNTSNNSQYYNGHPEHAGSNYPNNSAPIYNRPNGYQQMNGYSNGMLDSFDKSGSLDFHTSIKGESNNLDSYLSDPYGYEPENKRFHAMNC